ncbi:phage minor head protein [Microvirgula aerodenitrificans]|uniref:phage head morphogenesis protein n=1 Tax=Microvirgula aerodenitrificans TaxID=57480 RepID=UPI0028E26B47|nr:phage minor head protein [Microvirgula aerodenitrificans]
MPRTDFNLSYAIGLPPAEAIKYFEQKGFAIGFRWQDVWAEAHARAFTVAGVTKLDILTDIRNGLTDALKNGGTLADFQKQLQPMLEAKGWWGRGRVVDQATGEVAGKRLNSRRLETIFRQNMQSAYMAGRYQEQLAGADLRPYWEYVAVMDSRTRPAHRTLHGRVFRFDDPFWRTFYPPNGWRCRCRVRTRSQRDIDRLDLPVSSSAGRLETVDQPVGRDGETRPAVAFRGPDGKRFTTDAGFGYNPGRAAYQPELDRYPADVARQYVRGTLTGPDFARCYRTLESQVAERVASGQTLAQMRDGLVVGQRWPVAVLSDEYRQLLRAETQTVWLSDDTLVKQAVSREGQDIGLDDYWRVQDVIERAQLIVRQGGLNLVFVRRAGRIYHAVVKATASGRALFLTSFRESNAKAATQAMRRGEVIRNEWE